MDNSDSHPEGEGKTSPGSPTPGPASAPRRSRKTTDLTAEQVNKKRIMDRANQRTYRAKNKAHVRCLEDKIAELTYRLTESEERIRRQADLIRRLGGTEELNSNQESTSPHSTAPSAQTQGEISLAPTHVRTSPGPSRVMSLPVSSVVDHRLPSTQARDSITMTDFEDFLKNVGIDLNGSLAPNPSFPSRVFDLSRTNPLTMETPETRRKLSQQSEGKDITKHDEAASSILVDSHWKYRSQDAITQPWKRLLMHKPPRSHVEDTIINGSRIWRTSYLQQYNPPEKDADNARPDPPRLGVASLLNHDSSVAGAMGVGPPPRDLDVTRMPTDYIDEPKVRSLSLVREQSIDRSPYGQLPERLAQAYKLSHLINWMVCQTREAYEAMPTYLRPTELQTKVAHPAWVDLVTWPKARNAIILAGVRCNERRSASPGFAKRWGHDKDDVFDWDRDAEHFQQILTRNTSVGWPTRPVNALVQSDNGKYLMLDSSFEAHIRKMENWTSGLEMAEMFPFTAASFGDVEPHHRVQ